MYITERCVTANIMVIAYLLLILLDLINSRRTNRLFKDNTNQNNVDPLFLNLKQSRLGPNNLHNHTYLCVPVCSNIKVSVPSKTGSLNNLTDHSGDARVL